MIKIIAYTVCAVLTYYISGYKAFVMFMLCAIFLNEVIKDD